MRKQLRRIAIAIIATILATLPLATNALAACAGNIVKNGDTACHLTTSDGTTGTYVCEDGSNYNLPCTAVPSSE